VVYTLQNTKFGILMDHRVREIGLFGHGLLWFDDQRDIVESDMAGSGRIQIGTKHCF